MAEPEGTADFEERPDEIEDLRPETLVEDIDPETVDDDPETTEEGLDVEGMDEDLDPESSEEEEQEPPRRRLVAEFLDGQDEVADSVKSGLQLVAPPIHIEMIDDGQPIYQLDLSSDEPEGMIVEPEVDPNRGTVVIPDPVVAADPRPSVADSPHSPIGGDAHAAVKQIISDRDRQVMAAERDGLGAYELAAGLDGFVDKVLQTVRRHGS